MAWPCSGPRCSVRRIRRSNVPCRSSIRSFCSRVDILGDHRQASGRMSRWVSDYISVGIDGGFLNFHSTCGLICAPEVRIETGLAAWMPQSIPRPRSRPRAWWGARASLKNISASCLLGALAILLRNATKTAGRIQRPVVIQDVAWFHKTQRRTALNEIIAEQAHLLVHNLLLGTLKNESRTTKSVLAAVPSTNLDYRPDPCAKTANELLRHIASADNFFLKSVIRWGIRAR